MMLVIISQLGKIFEPLLVLCCKRAFLKGLDVLLKAVFLTKPQNAIV